MPGLFGDLDAAEVSDNPFYVAPGIYKCVLTEISLPAKKDGGHGLAVKWTVEDEEADEYNDSTLNQWANVYLTEDEVAEADAKAVKRDRANVKRMLTDIGMSNDEMNNIIDDDNELNQSVVDEYIGIEAYLTVKETADKNDPDKKYSNVSKVVLLENA